MTHQHYAIHNFVFDGEQKEVMSRLQQRWLYMITSLDVMESKEVQSTITFLYYHSEVPMQYGVKKKAKFCSLKHKNRMSHFYCWVTTCFSSVIEPNRSTDGWTLWSRARRQEINLQPSPAESRTRIISPYDSLERNSS